MPDKDAAGGAGAGKCGEKAGKAGISGVRQDGGNFSKLTILSINITDIMKQDINVMPAWETYAPISVPGTNGSARGCAMCS